MKRIIIISALTVVVATMVLSSCIRRDKNAKQRVLYTITRSQDLVDMADMTVTYKDGKGNNVTEKITGTLWQKAITIDTVPCELGLVDYKLTAKPASKLKKDSYELSAVFCLFDAKSKVLKYDFNDNRCRLVDFHELKRESIPAFIDIANDHGDRSIIYKVWKDEADMLRIETQENIDRLTEMKKRNEESMNKENRDTSYQPQLIEEKPVEFKDTDRHENSQDIKEIFGLIQYSLSVTNDLLDIADLEVTYKGTNGIDVIDTLTSESKELFSYYEQIKLALKGWAIQVDLGSIPAPAAMSIRYLAKPLSEEGKNKRYFLYTTMDITCFDAGMEQISWQLPYVDGTKLDEFFKLINDNRPCLDYTLQRKGSNRNLKEFVKNKK